jgi:hypothetical protein
MADGNRAGGSRATRAITGFASLAVVAAALACGGAERRARIDTLLAESAAPAATGPACGLAVGQFVVYELTRTRTEGVFRLFGGSPERGYRRTEVVAREGDAFWLRQNELWPDREIGFSALVRGYDRADPSQLAVVRFRWDDEGEVREVPRDDPDAAAFAEQTAEVIAAFKHLGHAGRRRRVEVPAGDFVARAVPISVSDALGRSSGFVWFTPEVPIFGFSKLELTRTTSRWFHSERREVLADFGLGEASQ